MTSGEESSTLVLPRSDLEYRPALAEASDFLRASNATRFLLLGGPLKSRPGLPDGFEDVHECRHVQIPEAQLPTGIYRFRLEDGCTVMLVTVGAAPGRPERGDRAVDGSSSLDNACGWFEHYWEQAEPIQRPRFGMHDDVTTVPDGIEAVVRHRHYRGGRWWYEVRAGGRTLQLEERFLEDFEGETSPLDWISHPAGSAREVAATLTRVKLEEHLTDTVYSFRASRTVFRPYQFRPVIKMLRTGTRRLLIADEVGMGKTIEAGLVWSEFEARAEADRVLVVCPSGLVEKWRTEMQQRFGFDAQVLDRDGLGDLLDRFETDLFPARYRAVCSLQRLRTWEHLERLNDLAPHFDLIVVDEAHALRNTNTMSFALGSLLSDWADILLFLSATPLNLGNDDLFNLLSLIEPGDFFDKHTLLLQLEPNAVLNRIYASVLDHGVSNVDRRPLLRSIPEMTFGGVLARRREFQTLERLLDKSEMSVAEASEVRQLCLELNTLSRVLTRTRRAEIEEERPVRDPSDIAVELSDAERRLYDTVRDWQAQRAAARGMPLHFIGQMPLRLAGSCLPATRDRILEQRAPAFRDDDIDDEDALDEDPWERPSPDVEAAALALGDTDTKFEGLQGALDRMVRDQGHRVLLFTFSRPVAAYLHRRLRDRFRVEVLHGDVAPPDRQRRIAAFRDGRYDVMVATRVASEGLDFEFCSAVVNYDLPWNPMEVEQRIGRIDRFGQQSPKIYVLNFATPGTIETDIIGRIHDRIGVFVESIGELEPILQEEFSDIKRIAFDFALSAAERQRQLDKALLAVETKAGLRRDFDDSADILNVLDHPAMDGFESDIIDAGRYVGQPELVRLLEDWASTSPGTRCRLSGDGRWLYLRGDVKLENDLRHVQAAGDRSAAEVDLLARDLRAEMEIRLCLDQETARNSGADLLSATHPLVRAALTVKQSRPTRFGAARLRSGIVAPGHYLVLVGLARWNGLRPAAEFWTAACAWYGQAVDERLGAELLTALAEAKLETATTEQPQWGLDHVYECEEQLQRRQTEEQRRREEDNAAQIEARRISLHDSHSRKVTSLHDRIALLNERGKTDAVALFESQLRVQERKLRDAEQELDARTGGSLSLEYVALCSLAVVR